MTDDDKTTTHDPGPGKASGEVDAKAAGQKTGPPGNGDRDQSAIDQGQDRLDHVEAGHYGHDSSIWYWSSPMTTTSPSPSRAASANGVSPSAAGKRTTTTLRPPSAD